jgi:hypothetical protein
MLTEDRYLDAGEEDASGATVNPASITGLGAPVEIRLAGGIAGRVLR